MSPTIVIDSSALVALLVDGGPAGDWVATTVAAASLAAPALAPYEAGNVLRRQFLAGAIEEADANLAHDDLLELAVEYWPYGVLAQRIWELRGNVTIYDAAYIALAERLDAQLVTLDARLARAPGPQCPIAFPPPSRLAPPG